MRVPTDESLKIALRVFTRIGKPIDHEVVWEIADVLDRLQDEKIEGEKNEKD